MSKSKKLMIESVIVSRGQIDEDATGRIIAWDRDERESCQAGTPGCAVDHTAETRQGRRERGCEGW